MNLTKEQMDRAGQIILERAAGLRCPGCGGQAWHMDEHIYLLMSPPVQQPQREVLLARSMGQAQAPPVPVFSELIQLVCQNCFGVQLFGARAMGLMGPPPNREMEEIRPEGATG